MAGRGCEAEGASGAGRSLSSVRPAFEDEALRAGSGGSGAAAPWYGTKGAAPPNARHPKQAALPAEPYAEICRDHEGVTPITRHNARYSGIGGV